MAPERALTGLAADNFAAAGSAAGKEWMAALPALARDLARAWGLTLTGDRLGHGYNAVVLAAGRGGRPLALKLAWPPEQVRDEAAALTAWRGRAAVELVACDVPRGALLLERLDAARSLSGLPVAAAAAVAGTLIRTLATVAPPSFPSLRSAASQLAATLQARQHALDDPVPGPWISLAVRLAASLAGDPRRALVHTDLHYDNILASRRPAQPWVAIDPRPAAGAPERSAAELLWTRVDELPGPEAITGLLDIIVEHGQLDRAGAVAWSFLRSIDYWLWGLEQGLTVDPPRCRRVASALAPAAELAAGPSRGGARDLPS